MDFLNLKGDYVVEILSYYLWGQSTPPSDLARKDNRVLIGKDYQARDERASITIEASAFDYMQYVDRYTNATNFGVFQKFFKYSFNEEELRLFKDRIENGFYVLGLDDIVKKLYKKNPFVDGEGKYNEENMDVAISHYGLDSNSSDYAKRAFAFGSTRIAFNEDVKFYINAKTYEPFCLSNLKLYPLEDNFDFESDNGFAKIINPYLEKKLDPLKIGRIVNIKFVDIEKIEPISISKKYFQELEDKKQNRLKSIYLMPPNSPATSLSTASSEPFLSSRAFLAYYNNNILPSGVLYTQDDDISTHLQNSTFSSQSKQAHSTTSPSSPKEPSFITLILQDEWGKAITNAKVIIKGFRYDESLSVVKLKRKSDTLGKIRFDKEKYFRDCYSFKVKLEDNEAYLSTPLQNAKRIFNNYVSHKEGLILKFKAKEHLVYDGFNVYYYKGRDLITSYLARSGTAKADNIKQSDKQIAHYFYQDEKDKSKGKKAYFYYDDASIKDQFGTLPEGKYYFKINEIAKDLNPSFLKDYPFEIGRTWGKYCVRLYTDKECSKTSKEIKDKDKEQTIIKDNLYLYSVNEKAEFGSSGSIGMAQGELLELFHHQSRFVEDEREGVVCTEVSYPKKETKKIVFANENIDLNTSFAPGTYIKLQLEEKEISEELTWAYIHCESETKKESFLNGAYIIKTDELEILKCNIIDKTSAFHLPISRNNEPVEETKDYKYYIIVFAYDAKKKSVPNEEDAYIIIDMSFRVGVGSDDGVRESVLRNNFDSNNKNIIQTNCIFNVFEAIEFLKTCQKIKEEISESNNLNFFKNYPQLAGKIAYIYYRFDLADEEFIKSVSDGNEYLKERERFYTIALEIYNQNSTYKTAFEKRLQNELVDINIVKDFLKNFAKRLGIDEKDLPVIGYNPQKGDSGTYDYKANTLKLNSASIYIDFVDTIIHEFRHFYIYRIKNNSQNSIEKLLYINTTEFYIMWNFHILFNSYDKKCLIYDSVEYGTLKCYLNRTYYESRKTEKKEAEGKVDCPLYFIQPAERDAKIIAGKFREKIGATNA
ncbi:hypothetical protein CHELV3228_0667 [Campylobacter helveticus]|uniref:hypothetical protein n=5 Tax=Campylobacter helveticus TaxID=28898 RepID=UPI0009C292AD|nr:hypothetical protein [Campylobacter helveticus]ARE80283.1 hypothetical protein CHELV3228_0667 [Campylobacter helveticus]SUW82972.1 Uncharacterised protein [Campylobacter helveticus]